MNIHEPALTLKENVQKVADSPITRASNPEIQSVIEAA